MLAKFTALLSREQITALVIVLLMSAAIVYPQIVESCMPVVILTALWSLPTLREYFPCSFRLGSGFFVSWCVVAASFSALPYISFKFVSLFTMYFCAMLFMFWATNTYSRIRQICYILIPAVIIVSLYAVWQILNYAGDTPLIGVMPSGTDPGRATGSTFHPIIFSGYLFILNVFFLVISLKSLSGITRSLRLLAWVTAMCGIIGMMLSVTRGGWLALEGVLLLWIMLEWKYNKKLAFGLAAVAIIIACSFLSIPTLSERATVQDVSANWRLVMWKAAWQMFCDHPLIGVGLHQFGDLFYNQYCFEPNPEPGWQNAHSDYLNFLAEAGLLGLVTYVGMIGTLWWDNFRKYYQNRSDVWALLCLLLTTGLALEGLTYNYFAIGVNMYVFFMLIGMAYAARNLQPDI